MDVTSWDWSYVLGANELLDVRDLVRLTTRLILNLCFASLVILGVYYRLYRNREYVFTYFLFNVITFCLCFLLRKVPIELGFALGLFAVFGILRYRTEPIRIRDLTYLFIVIGLGILNALANKKISVAELAVVNVVITGATALLELNPKNREHNATPVFYDNLELLQPHNQEALYEDLRKRTGFEVVRVEVHRIDMLRDAAELTVFHNKPST